jgi:hypothetical protein
MAKAQALILKRRDKLNYLVPKAEIENLTPHHFSRRKKIRKNMFR